MSQDIIPILSSTHSLLDSILTVSSDIYQKIEEKQPNGSIALRVTDEIELPDDEPISVFAIAKKHKIEPFILIDTEFSSFWQAYEAAQKLKIHLVYGIKLKICVNGKDKTPESSLTESNIVVLFKNSQAYYDFVPIYTQAATEFAYNGKRIDWKSLQEKWTNNLELVIPFYSSFIARNLFRLNSICVPQFGDIKPSFLRQKQGLPFDPIIKTHLEKYCVDEHYDIQDAHWVYYYKNDHVTAYQTLKCLSGRKAGKFKTLARPELPHFSSPYFSFESYLVRIKKTL